MHDPHRHARGVERQQAAEPLCAGVAVGARDTGADRADADGAEPAEDGGELTGGLFETDRCGVRASGQDIGQHRVAVREDRVGLRAADVQSEDQVAHPAALSVAVRVASSSAGHLPPFSQ